MSEFNFVSSLSEVKGFIAHLFDLGCFAVPEIPYRSMEYKHTGSASELRFERTKGWHTFLFTRPEWGNQPFEMIFADNVHIGAAYFVSSKSGPPNIHFSYCDYLQTGNDDDLVSGLITIYSEYWTTEGTIPLPDGARKVFDEITKVIKRASLRRKANFRQFWFTQTAWHAIEGGTAISPVEFQE